MPVILLCRSGGAAMDMTLAALSNTDALLKWPSSRFCFFFLFCFPHFFFIIIERLLNRTIKKFQPAHFLTFAPFSLLLQQCGSFALAGMWGVGKHAGDNMTFGSTVQSLSGKKTKTLTPPVDLKNPLCLFTDYRPDFLPNIENSSTIGGTGAEGDRRRCRCRFQIRQCRRVASKHKTSLCDTVFWWLSGNGCLFAPTLHPTPPLTPLPGPSWF